MFIEVFVATMLFMLAAFFFLVWLHEKEGQMCRKIQRGLIKMF